MTTRNDLLALTLEDLAAISNRGTVKRVTRELDAAKVSVTALVLREDATLEVSWSDDVTCTLHGDRPLQDAECTCPATTLCRHIIRSVLAYQHAQDGEDTTKPPSERGRAWDPGELSEEVIANAIPKATRARARKLSSQGTPVELRRGKKPLAHFHELGHTTLFQVPEDLRYTRCDCAEEAPCSHVAMAIDAFRALDPQRHTGFVTLGTVSSIDVPDDLLRDAQAALTELLFHGFAHSPKAAFDRLHQLETQLADARQTWHATILHDLRAAHNLYLEHDARFHPASLPEWVGEFLIRHQALLGEQEELPRLFIQGSSTSKRSTLGQARLVGLGCHAILRDKSVELQAMMQDMRTGTLMALTQTFPDPADVTPPPLSELGVRAVGKGRGLAQMGASQIVLKKAHLDTGHGLTPAWGSSSTYPQGFDWETVLAPVRAEDFEELRRTLLAAPPTALRPRVVGENFHVVPVCQALEPAFSSIDQAVIATLVDPHGGHAALYHPYTNRNRHGTERLLHWLETAPEGLCYVAGVMRLTSGGLRVEPTAIVFEDDSKTKFLVQPWVDAQEQETASTTLGSARPPRAPVDIFRAELRDVLGEIFLLGFHHIDQGVHDRFTHLLDLGLMLGFDRMMTPIADICSLLANPQAKESDLAAAYFEVCTLHTLMCELA